MLDFLNKRLEEWLGAFLLAVMACVAFANVLVRYCTNLSFAASEEITVNFFVWIVLLGTSRAFREGTNFSMNLLYDALPRFIRKILYVFSVICCLIFFAASAIPSNANDYTAFDSIFGGTWFVLLGSTVAFLASAVINNTLNFAIGKSFRKNPDGKLAFAMRSYVSTFIGQFLDNFIFSIIVFVGFAPIFWNGFSWTPLQCATCALTGALAELIMEIAFSPIGYRITKKWKAQNVGKEYLDYIEKEKQK